MAREVYTVAGHVVSAAGGNIVILSPGRLVAILERVSHVLGVAAPNQRARWWPVGLLALLVPLGIWLASAGYAESQSAAAESKQTQADASAKEDAKPPVKEKENSQTQQLQRLRQFLSTRLDQPAPKGLPEALVFQPIRENLLYSLLAVNVDTGKARHVTDFVCHYPEIVQQFDNSLAIIKANRVGLLTGQGKPRFGHFAFVKDQFWLVDLRTGEKTPFQELKDWDAWYLQFSPDQQKLSFLGRVKLEGEKEKQPGLYVLDLKTLQIRRLLKGDLKTEAHWSPDSRLLVVSKSGGYQNRHELVLIDAATGNAKETDWEGAGAYFTPDGKSLIFSAGFKKSGSWSAGVPTWGNLFIAKLPNGKPKPLTHLPAGGATGPLLLSDGSRLLYWVTPEDKNEFYRLHVIDLESGEDHEIMEATGREVSTSRRLESNSRILQSYLVFDKDHKVFVPKVKVISLGENKPSVRKVELRIPKSSSEKLITASQLFVDRLVEVFSLAADAIADEDADRFDQAAEKYARSRDLLGAIIEQLAMPDNKAKNPLCLKDDDLKPYFEGIEKDAALSPTGLLVRTVHRNLGWIGGLLDMQYRWGFKRLPTDHNGEAKPEDYVRVKAERLDLEACAKQAPGAEWGMDYHLYGKDVGRVRRIFVIPGVDPDKVLTSYEVVKPDTGDSVLVIRTPVLPNGKRLEATYRVKRLKNNFIMVDTKVKEVD